MVSTFFLARFILGLLGIFFTYLLGLAIARLQQGKLRGYHVFRPAVRALLALLALLWPLGPDALAITVYALALLAGALGFWNAWRPKHEEDLSRKIVPHD
jgi:hypothetical protein